MRRTVHCYNARNRLPDELIQCLQCASKRRNHAPKDTLLSTPSYDGTALPHPDMSIRHNGCDPARRGWRDGGTRNSRPPSTPTYMCRCGGTPPSTPTGLRKDRNILQPGKVGQLLRSVATIPERKRHPGSTTSPMHGGRAVLHSYKSNRSKNRCARRRRAAARAEAGSCHPDSHRNAPIRSPISQASGRREVPAVHRPRARPGDRLPVQTSVPSRSIRQRSMHGSKLRRSGLLNRSGEGRPPQRHRGRGHQTRDPRSRGPGVEDGARSRHDRGGERGSARRRSHGSSRPDRSVIHLQKQRKIEGTECARSKRASGRQPPHRPREKKCPCGNAYFDFAETANGGWNTRPYEECCDCCLSKRKSEKRVKKGGRKTKTAALAFDSDSSSGSPLPAGISSASLHMNATLCGRSSPAGDHPRLDVTFTFPTASGFVEMKWLPTDGPTDTPSYRDAKTHLKNGSLN